MSTWSVKILDTRDHSSSQKCAGNSTDYRAIDQHTLCKIVKICKLEKYIGMKCVIYVNVIQAGKINWICVKKF